MTVTLANLGVDLAKTSDFDLAPWEVELINQSNRAFAKANARPWYPIMGHREGLRMNDLVTLASAFSILALEGGTAHMSEIPGTTRSDGSVVRFVH
jgi:hypothetical protein